MIETLNHLGTRVCIQTLEVHIESCYCLMNIPVPRNLTLVDILLCKQKIHRSIHKYNTYIYIYIIYIYNIIYIYACIHGVSVLTTVGPAVR